MPSEQSVGPLPSLIENCAAMLWYEAGAVVKWERAAPEVQERYREKARKALAMRDEQESWG